MTTIVDYGMGNLGSVKNMLKKIGEGAVVSSDARAINEATKIILPGVGAFDNAMINLQQLDLIAAIKQKVLEDKTPILGICLGMQLLTNGSEEGKCEGFGFIEGSAKRFNFQDHDKKLPVPHMGWNRVHVKKESPLFEGMPDDPRFYFVHSYAVECANRNDILTTTEYGYEFVSCFEHENILGCQFHPEKSHKFGMQLFKNFVEYY
ncbi:MULTISPECIES: imidazole glycerol phosphate synthase subunit HisH [Sulfurimonas]|uniref:Imidazole glycerol phosphate synthase subunit HisH n=1 Tax=Sulfurimonas diazotrophicus TaxID=3131939 RepID=A0ABZ3H8W3_9BACT